MASQRRHVVPARVASCVRCWSSDRAHRYRLGVWQRPDDACTHRGGRAGVGRARGLRLRATSVPSPRCVSSAWPRWWCRLIGAFLPWATTDAARLGLPLRSSVAGVDLGAGQLLCGALALALLLSWWHLVNPRRSTATALFATWLGSLALTLYETVDIIAVPTARILRARRRRRAVPERFAALVGSVSSVSDAAQLWSRGGRLSPGALWVGGLAALVVVAAASIVGYRSGVSPVGPVPTATPDRLFHGGAGGSGPSGGSGSGGSSGDTGPSGSTGGSGNTGFGGEPGNSGLGNSGLGNSGPGFFGNSGSGNSGNSGNSGPGAFGNSGSGNSGPGAFGISHLPSSGTPWPSA